MGYYLNSNKVYSLYKSETGKPYFIDKTKMLRELITLAEQGNNHIMHHKAAPVREIRDGDDGRCFFQQGV